MEIILAIVVVSAVIFFGALISMGNERQRKAIDGLREQVVLWAVQDLNLKTESIIRDIKIEDPYKWLSNIAEKAFGEPFDLSSIEFADTLQAIICDANDGKRVLFSPVSPIDIHKLKHERQNKLLRIGKSNPLMLFSHNAIHVQMSTLNNGPFFDAELKIVWKTLCGKTLLYNGIIWIYLLQQ